MIDINIDDLMANTHIDKDRWNDNELPYIAELWKILKSFTQHEKELFLVFCTGTNRPPLLGFKYLQPKFCIVK